MSNITENEAKLEIKKIIKNKWFVPILLIIIAIGFSTHYRMMTDSMPAVEMWAENSMWNYYRGEITKQLTSQYPNLPQANLNELVELELQKIPEDVIKTQIPQIAEDTKNKFRDDNGDPYLQAIDPYMWWHYARNFVEYGTPGDKNEGGKTYDTLRGGRIDREEGLRFHGRLLAWQYKILNRFTGISLMKSVFLFPVIFIALSIIPAFFITKKYIGNFGAFFTAMIVAINANTMARTFGGFSDTDTYNIFCPLYMVWFLFISFYSKNYYKKALFAFLSAIMVLVFQRAWGGWYYMYDMILAMMGIYGVFILFKHRERLKSFVFTSGTFVVSSFLMMLLFSPWRATISFIKGPIWVLTMKSVATTTIWPNVLTTVAEFGTSPIITLVTYMGGAILCIVSLLGLVYLYKKDKRMLILLVLWLVGTTYSFTKGKRFSILMMPAFAIAFGVGVGYLLKLSYKLLKLINIENLYAKGIMGCLLFLLLVTPLKDTSWQMRHNVPSMSDAWFDSLIGIKEDCDDGIITSWWDFGHWFYSISRRRVTFDGGDQGKRIHWVGKALSTENEVEAVRILRMLNCGQNSYYEALIEDNMTEKEAVEEIYNKLAEGFDFCEAKDVEPLPQYLIASTDMIGKSGVWAHFGGWNFGRAQHWLDVRKMSESEGIEYLIGVGYDENEVEGIYQEIMDTPADQWICPWPSYGQKMECTQTNTTIICGELEISLNPLNVNTEDVRYIAYIDNGKFKKVSPSPRGDIGIILSPTRGIWFVDQSLVASMFTRMYFFEGIGLEHIKQFSYKKAAKGEEIYVYKVEL